MPRKTTTIATSFSKSVSNLETTRVKMEQLLMAAQIQIPDIERVYAGLFLDMFTHFESILETLFLGLLAGDLYSPTQNIVRLATITPRPITRDIVFNWRAYIDWIPYTEKTIPLANNYFQNGLPFTVPSKPQMANLRDYHTIRNALAHKSKSAHDSFQNMIASLPLLPQQKTPAGYLRTTPAGVGQTQYEIAAIELQSIANALCA